MKTMKIEVEVPNIEAGVSPLIHKMISDALQIMQNKLATEPGWFRREGAAIYAGVSQSTIAEWQKRGLASHPMSSGVILFSKADIDEFISSHL